jgi:hypothetical protein
MTKPATSLDGREPKGDGRIEKGPTTCIEDSSKSYALRHPHLLKCNADKVVKEHVNDGGGWRWYIRIKPWLMRVHRRMQMTCKHCLRSNILCWNCKGV